MPDISSIAIAMICHELPLISELAHKIRNPQAPNQPKYNSVFGAMRGIVANEGFRTIWKGVAAVIAGAGPSHAVHFAAYILA